MSCKRSLRRGLFPKREDLAPDVVTFWRVAASFSDFIAFLAPTNCLTSAWQRSRAVRASASSAGLPSAFAFSNRSIAALERVKSCPAVSTFFQPLELTSSPNREISVDTTRGLYLT